MLETRVAEEGTRRSKVEERCRAYKETSDRLKALLTPFLHQHSLISLQAAGAEAESRINNLERLLISVQNKHHASRREARDLGACA